MYARFVFLIKISLRIFFFGFASILALKFIILLAQINSYFQFISYLNLFVVLGVCCVL